MNDTPRGLRPHIVLIGNCNAGKSTLLNALTETTSAIVSEERGTTTDPVYKNMELLPFGPITFVDTPGLDDEEGIGNLRVKRSKQELSKADFVLIVSKPSEWNEQKILAFLKKAPQDTPHFIIFTHLDLESEQASYALFKEKLPKNHYCISPNNIVEVRNLRNLLATALQNSNQKQLPLLSGLVKPGDLVILVVPIDLEAPRGRLILPQVQTIRETLDADAHVLVVKERELDSALQLLKKSPDLVICDSQVVLKVAGSLTPEIPLTTFSILLSRQKGELQELVRNAQLLKNLKDGDKILIAEACTHHVMCDDIGRVKIPRFLKQYSGRNLDLHFASGNFPEDLSPYNIVIHCGACMITRSAMLDRMKLVKLHDAAMTNYGMAISETQGLLSRVLEPFKNEL